jgi:hypothetical protein
MRLWVEKLKLVASGFRWLDVDRYADLWELVFEVFFEVVGEIVGLFDCEFRIYTEV